MSAHDSNGTGKPSAPAAEASSADLANKRMALLKIYVKDLSFEAPQSPQNFTAPPRGEPQIQLNMKSATRKLTGDQWEIVLTLTVDAKSAADASTLFLVELQQAGLFALSGYSDAELAPLLGGYCLHVLYPYAREAVSDLVTRGGFPPLLLQPINFDAVYRQSIAAQQAGMPATPAGPPNGSTH